MFESMNDDQKKANLKSEFKVKCPQCGLLSLFSSNNPHRPFCSERCQMIDLGAWASEDYKVPVNSPMEDEFSSENTGNDEDYES